MAVVEVARETIQPPASSGSLRSRGAGAMPTTVTVTKNEILHDALDRPQPAGRQSESGFSLHWRPRLILDVRARCDPRGLGPVAVIRCRHGLRHACGRENVDRRRSRRGTRGGGGSRSRARRVRRPPASWSRGAHFDTALAQLESRLAWRLVYGRHSGSASRVRCRYSNPCWQRFASRKTVACDGAPVSTSTNAA